MLNSSKISSKEKFNKILEGLISLQTVQIDKEMLSLNQNVITSGVLEKRQNNYVISANKKHFVIDKSVASGYKCGDVLDCTIQYNDTQQNVIILGKDKRKRIQQNRENFAPATQSDDLILGRVIKISHDNLVFIPNNRSIDARQIPILNDKKDWAKFQDKPCMIQLQNLDGPAMGGTIKKVLGDAGNPIHEYEAIAQSYGAITTWADCADEISQIPTSVDISKLNLITEEQAQYGQKGKTVDLRHLLFTTVDPATCKDMDDAIYSYYDKDGNIVIYTAVANVTKYVNLDSQIGQKYLHGGFTIYSPNKAYSILPPELSTGICSLNPNEDRLAFVVKKVLDPITGDVKGSFIYDAVIKSKQKYSYEQAQEIVDSVEDQDVAKQFLQQKIAKGQELSLNEQTLMNYFAGLLIKTEFERRKMLRFVSNDEREIQFDGAMQHVVDIKPVEHLMYHEIIEAFMIAANEATAKFANDHNLPNIYRIHDKPNPKKLKRAKEFFDCLGVEFDGDLSVSGTRAVVEQVKDTTNEDVVNKFLIKMQSRAKYSNSLLGDNYSEKLYSTDYDQEVAEVLGTPISHYALQSHHYSHTTSPIRRVPDYFTQHNILASIHQTPMLTPKNINYAVEISNERQLEVDQAEQDFAATSSALYAERHIGETLRGHITKIRYTSPEEEFVDDIVIIAKDSQKGICAEVPLSQVLGRPANDCYISEQRCAVYDYNGNVLVKLCNPIDFIIVHADAKTMTVIGKTNRSMMTTAEQRELNSQKHRKMNGRIKENDSYYDKKHKAKMRHGWDKSENKKCKPSQWGDE